MRTRLLSFIALVLCSVHVFFPAITHAAIGVSPGRVTIDKALNDIPQYHTVKIIRTYLLDKDIKIIVEYSGPDAQFISGPTEIFFPARVDRVDYTFEVLPKELPNGNYQATIRFLPDLNDLENVDGSGGQAVAVRAGNTLLAAFTVTDEQLIAFDVRNLAASNIEEGMELGVKFEMINKGNVSWRPDEIIFTVRDERGEIVFTKRVSASEIALISPGKTESRLIELMTGLAAGQYLLTADFYYGNQIVYSGTVPFHIFPPGTLRQFGELITLTTNKEVYSPNENIRILGVFKNTGEIPVRATFVAEILDGDELLDLLVSDPLRVEIGEQVEFSIFTKLAEEKEYTVRGYVEYGQKKTEAKQALIRVEIPRTGKPLYLWLLLLLPLILGFLFFVIWKRRKKEQYPLFATCPITLPPKKEEEPVMQPQAQPQIEHVQQLQQVEQLEHPEQSKQPPQTESPKNEEKKDDDLWTISL